VNLKKDAADYGADGMACHRGAVLSYLLRHKEFVDSQRVSEKLKKD